MIKKFKKVFIGVGVLCLLVGSAACTKKLNTREDKSKFSNLSQKEKKEYISKYLYENYNMICNISEVKQKQETAVKNEAYYFAIAKTQENKNISLWIDNKGNIVDTYFVLALQESINTEINLLVKELNIPRIETYTEFREMPIRTWSESEDMKEMLSTEKTFTYIWCFVSKDNENIYNEMLMKMVDELKFCDAAIYIYECDNPQNVDIKTFDLTSYVSVMTTKRK